MQRFPAMRATDLSGNEGMKARHAHDPRHRWRSVAFDLGCAIGGLLVLLWCMRVVDGDAAAAWEISLLRFFNDLPGWLTPPVWLMMQMGNMVVVPIAIAGALLIRRWALAGSFLVAGAGKYAGARIIKDIEAR